RPALVLSNEAFELAPNGLVLAAPTTRADRGVPAHPRREAGVAGLPKTSFIRCDQPGAASDRRFLRHRGVIPD
ncbi:unnamed protein product, partial [Phaeothamnion confervicola]